MYLIVIIVGLVVIGGIYLLMRPQKTEQPVNQYQSPKVVDNKPAEPVSNPSTDDYESDDSSSQDDNSYTSGEDECRCSAPGGACCWK